ncbi:hypothetical protein NC651_010038 [Populus alba x Populus x berolinensis]|nr:hypothetical protein NC651_010038 [Populus alba x Populus x berolinensis]
MRAEINDNFPGSSGYFPELVAVTVSHPPGQAYDEKASSTSTKHAEPPREEIFGDFSFPEADQHHALKSTAAKASSLVLLLARIHQSIPRISLNWCKTQLYFAVLVKRNTCNNLSRNVQFCSCSSRVEYQKENKPYCKVQRANQLAKPNLTITASTAAT